MCGEYGRKFRRFQFYNKIIYKSAFLIFIKFVSMKIKNISIKDDPINKKKKLLKRNTFQIQNIQKNVNFNITVKMLIFIHVYM